MDDFLILLQAKLDEAKSKENVKGDIGKIQSQLNKLKIQAEIDPKAITNLTKQLEGILNQKITISNINMDIGQTIKNAHQTGQRIGNAINQGVTNAVSKANKTLKSFSELKIGTGNIDAVVDKKGIVNAEKSLDKIKQTYSVFGQVKITDKIFDSDGNIQKFKVNIEQVNGELKETRSFMMALNGSSFAFPNDVIKGSESIVQHLDKTKNVINQTGEAINELANKAQVDKIQLSLDNGHGVSQYQNRIQGLINDFQKYGVATENAKAETKSLQQIFDNMKGLSGQDLVNQADKFEQEFKSVKISIEEAKLAYDKFAQPVSDEKVSTLIIRIQKFLDQNTNITKEAQVQLSNYIQELNGGNISLARWNTINAELKKTESTMSMLGRLGKSFTDQIKDVGRNVTSYLSMSSIFMSMFSKTRESIIELKELDDILTEISKTSDLTSQELKELGLSSYDTASKYGRVASDYLSGIQSMSQSGFYGKKGEAMAEQSLLAQAAGDMSQEVADKYVLATNAAYKFNGEAQRLNEVLDGQNSISNRNSVALEDMATAMTDAGTVASSYNVAIEDLSAMIGTMESVTKAGGDEVGNSIKSILINLQNVTSDKIKNTLDKANASMTETVNGAEKLRNPIEILRDLADTFNQLDEDEPLRAEILTNVAGKYQATKLAALLQNMDMFDKMLVDYSEGSGSAMEEANKSATNLTGSINTLSNSWTKFVNTLINSEQLKLGVNVLNDLVQGVTSLTEVLTPLGTIGIGTGIFSSIKNVGKPKMFGFNYCLNMPTVC